MEWTNEQLQEVWRINEDAINYYIDKHPPKFTLRKAGSLNGVDFRGIEFLTRHMEGSKFVGLATYLNRFGELTFKLGPESNVKGGAKRENYRHVSFVMVSFSVAICEHVFGEADICAFVEKALGGPLSEEISAIEKRKKEAAIAKQSKIYSGNFGDWS